MRIDIETPSSYLDFYKENTYGWALCGVVEISIWGMSMGMGIASCLSERGGRRFDGTYAATAAWQAPETAVPGSAVNRILTTCSLSK
jgi:hypothetical protein